MTFKTYRFSLTLTLCVLVAVSAAFYCQRRESTRLRAEVVRVTQERDEANRRLKGIEQSIVIPAGNRCTIDLDTAEAVRNQYVNVASFPLSTVPRVQAALEADGIPSAIYGNGNLFVLQVKSRDIVRALVTVRPLIGYCGEGTIDSRITLKGQP